jgi:hypothetical protein
MARKYIQALSAVMGLEYLTPFVQQVQLNQVNNLSVVVGNEYLVSFHASPPSVTLFYHFTAMVKNARVNDA